MFIRSRVAKGTTYHAVVESYRDQGGMVRHRQVLALGTSPTLQDAVAATRREIARLHTQLRKITAYWPSSSPRPRSAEKDYQATQRRLALQERHLARLQELKAQFKTEAAGPRASRSGGANSKGTDVTSDAESEDRNHARDPSRINMQRE